MEAVPRMPMIWLDLKEAGEFQFSPSVRQVSWVWSEATGLRSKVGKKAIKERRQSPLNEPALRVFTLEVPRHSLSLIEYSRRNVR